MSAASALRDRCRRLGWAAGLPGLALILGLSAVWFTPRLEAQLGAEADAVARATATPGAEPWLRVAVEGRDLLVTGEAPDAATRDAAHQRLAAIDGVRRIVGPVGVVEPASPFVWIATKGSDGVDVTGVRPAEIGAGALAEQLVPALDPGTALHDRARAALGAPPDFAAAAAYALARLRALAPGGRVMLEDMRLSVMGEATSVADDEALRTALAELPTGYGLGRVEILPAVVPDFRFVVSREPGGTLTLSGYVVSDSARAEIRTLAPQASETGQVEDRMRSARGLPGGVDAAAMARFVLKLAVLLQEGSVSVADARISLNGVALDAQAIPEIEDLLREAMPAGLSRGDVALSTRPLSPYRILLRRDADAVTLSGHLPDAEAREGLLGTFRPRLFRERLIDRTRLGDGAPPELARALRATATALILLARGEARFADRSITLTGESLYAQGGRRVSDDLSAAMPPGWTAEVSVTTPDAASAGAPENCVAALGAKLTGQTLLFPAGSTTLAPAFYPLLDGIAALGKTCPTLRLVVTGHPDPSGATAAPKPVVETAVESTASLDAGKDAGKTQSKGPIRTEQGHRPDPPARMPRIRGPASPTRRTRPSRPRPRRLAKWNPPPILRKAAPSRSWSTCFRPGFVPNRSLPLRPARRVRLARVSGSRHGHDDATEANGVTLLATLLWPLVAASALLGAAVGGLTGLPRTPTARWTAVLLVLIAGLAGGLAVGGLLPGRAGFWLEGGGLGLGSYLIGAILAAGVVDRIGTRP